MWTLHGSNKYFEDYMNSFLSVFLGIICLLFPFVSYKVLNHLILNPTLIEKKYLVYGSLYEGLRPTKQAFMFNVVFLVKRLFYAVAAILL